MWLIFGCAAANEHDLIRKSRSIAGILGFEERFPLIRFGDGFEDIVAFLEKTVHVAGEEEPLSDATQHPHWSLESKFVDHAGLVGD